MPTAPSDPGKPDPTSQKPAEPGRAQLFRPKVTGILIATEEASEPRSGVAALVTRLKHVLIGKPLSSSELAHERIGKAKALAVFASDALSSTAYATEEILLVLTAAGPAAIGLSIPIGLAILVLLAIVVLSYRQTIFRYPAGGGTYIVTKDNLGLTPALIAASALMIDYVLTVAVSVAAGMSAIISACPILAPVRVELALLAIAALTIVNLRGIRESATLFTAPTYLFIGSVVLMLASGAWRMLQGLPPLEVVASQPEHITESIGAFLILRAFASGCSALTGTEAISDGVPAFRDPQPANAARTLGWMAFILGALFLGITVEAHHFGILPMADETVLSQLARATVGHGPAYFVIQAVTTLILVLAANTSFADFPRLAYFLARDRFMPRQFVFRGDRLAFSTGILALGILSGAVVVAFGGDPHHLIPLYAVGVFISFTFSQTSMAWRWWKRREPGWQVGLPINSVGALVTGVVALVIGATKFAHGAWMVIVLLPALVAALYRIRRHYLDVAEQLQFKRAEAQPHPMPPTRVVVPLSTLNKASLRTLRYAMALSNEVTALHVTDDTDASNVLLEAWKSYNLNMAAQLVIVESPYRSLVSPVLAFIETLRPDSGKTPVTVVLSEFVPRNWWEFFLHNQDAFRLKIALFFTPGVVVVDMPHHLDH